MTSTVGRAEARRRSAAAAGISVDGDPAHVGGDALRPRPGRRRRRRRSTRPTCRGSSPSCCCRARRACSRRPPAPSSSPPPSRRCRWRWRPTTVAPRASPDRRRCVRRPATVVDVGPRRSRRPPSSRPSASTSDGVIVAAAVVVVVGDRPQDQEPGDDGDDGEHDAQRRADRRAGVADARRAAPLPRSGWRVAGPSGASVMRVPSCLSAMRVGRRVGLGMAPVVARHRSRRPVARAATQRAADR